MKKAFTIFNFFVTKQKTWNKNKESEKKNNLVFDKNRVNLRAGRSFYSGVRENMYSI